MVFDIQKPRRLIAELEIGSESVKQPDLIAIQRAADDTVMELTAFLDLPADPRELRKAQIARVEAANPVVENVELRPGLEADQVSNAARVLARRPNRVADRVRVLLVDDVKPNDVARFDAPIAL